MRAANGMTLVIPSDELSSDKRNARLILNRGVNSIFFLHSVQAPFFYFLYNKKHLLLNKVNVFVFHFQFSNLGVKIVTTKNAPTYTRNM